MSLISKIRSHFDHCRCRRADHRTNRCLPRICQPFHISDSCSLRIRTADFQRRLSSGIRHDFGLGIRSIMAASVSYVGDMFLRNAHRRLHNVRRRKTSCENTRQNSFCFSSSDERAPCKNTIGICKTRNNVAGGGKIYSSHQRSDLYILRLLRQNVLCQVSCCQWRSDNCLLRHMGLLWALVRKTKRGSVRYDWNNFRGLSQHSRACAHICTWDSCGAKIGKIMKLPCADKLRALCKSVANLAKITF